MAIVQDKIEAQGRAGSEIPVDPDSDAEDEPNKQIQLLDESSDEENENDLHKLKVNRKYAKRFHEKHRRDDLFRAKEMGLLEGGSSEDEEEDEKGEALTKSLDVDILKTISMIRTKDRRIYDKNYKPFQQGEEYDDDEDEDKDGKLIEQSKNRKSPFTYKDMVRQKAEKAIMNNGQMDDEEESDSDAEPETHSDPTYAEKQRKLKDAFKNVNSDDDGEDDILELKVKTNQEKLKDDDDFATFINSVKQNKKASQKLKSNMNVLESYFKEPAKDQDEEFLRSFVLNKGWVSKYASEDDEDEQNKEDDDVEDSDDEDLEQLEKAEEFENKYNFRFEEPDAHIVKSYPRKIEGSLRREKNARKNRREEKKKRKLELKRQREEEIKRLKNLKREELQSRLMKAKREIGVTASSNMLTEKDLDDDFDPEKHDAMMKNMFDDNYYEQDDGKKLEKPDISDLMDDGDIINEAEEEDQVNPAEDGEDDSGEGEDDGIEANGLTETDMDELYKLDYEGTAGGIKTRFRYTKVKPESWGLTTKEILETDDTILNEYVSLKKIVPYLGFDWKVTQKRRRRFRQRVKESNRTKKEKKLLDKKKKEKWTGTSEIDNNVHPSDEEQQDDQSDNKLSEVTMDKNTSESSKSKRKRKRKKKYIADTDVQPSNDDTTEINSSPHDDETKVSDKKKRKRKRKKSKVNTPTEAAALL